MRICTRFKSIGCRVASCIQNPNFIGVHRADGIDTDDVGKRAQEHNAEQPEQGKHRNTKPQAYVQGILQCLFSVHVDGIKCAARKGAAGPLLKHFNDKVARGTADCNCFFHAGIHD